jgi:DNA-binding CsgD family transcriptional regulator
MSKKRKIYETINEEEFPPSETIEQHRVKNSFVEGREYESLPALESLSEIERNRILALAEPTFTERQMFILKCLTFGRTPTEIAKIMKCKRGQIATEKARIREKLYNIIPKDSKIMYDEETLFGEGLKARVQPKHKSDEDSYYLPPPKLLDRSKLCRACGARVLDKRTKICPTCKIGGR